MSFNAESLVESVGNIIHDHRQTVFAVQEVAHIFDDVGMFEVSIQDLGSSHR